MSSNVRKEKRKKQKKKTQKKKPVETVGVVGVVLFVDDLNLLLALNILVPRQSSWYTYHI